MMALTSLWRARLRQDRASRQIGLLGKMHWSSRLKINSGGCQIRGNSALDWARCSHHFTSNTGLTRTFTERWSSVFVVVVVVDFKAGKSEQYEQLEKVHFQEKWKCAVQCGELKDNILFFFCLKGRRCLAYHKAVWGQFFPSLDATLASLEHHWSLHIRSLLWKDEWIQAKPRRQIQIYGAWLFFRLVGPLHFWCRCDGTTQNLMISAR